MRIPFTQVDAFAEEAFKGNPAAVMPLPKWLDDNTLLSIAVENNLSETAFLVPDASGEADYELRWFTPGAEVALCGHATLASGHVVLSSDTDRASVRFRTRQAGVLEVARDAHRYAMALPAWVPQAKPLPEIVAGLELPQGAVQETLWHDKGYALVVVENEAQVRNCAPDMRALAPLGPFVIIVAAPGETTDIVSRVFVPAFDIDEDPVTGSAHAVMVPYWAQRLGRDRMSAYQASARGGRLSCRLDGDRVVLGGACVTVIEGTFLLP
ncbi:phenazine biosynthesis protein PhzF family [Sphingomonas palmae]|uniref:Phenazine biosynthesis protein PhzF family n=1 Tax=Sphingomonas palmae TaxID=1855283 RepID=A0A1H7M3S5_9SPHN|nr:PhzF family phenazine biosynthesis protein [Sphingomonas palmae]SEL05781.1 phenazine biosynthesis protein PhzF family [Sphingomonas palmae]